MAELGRRYRDQVTMFEGTAIARAEYAYSGPQVLLAYADYRGLPASIWLDEQRLTEIDVNRPPLGISQS